jgi:hypothetical protein
VPCCVVQALPGLAFDSDRLLGLSRDMYSEIDPPALMVSMWVVGGGVAGVERGDGVGIVGGWGWCVQGAERGLLVVCGWGGLVQKRGEELVLGGAVT